MMDVIQYPSCPSTIMFHLILINDFDLVGTGTVGIKGIAQPFLDQSSGHFNAHHSLTHTQDLSVVTQDGSLHTVTIMCGDCSDPVDFIGGDGHPETGATDQESTIDLMGSNEMGCIHRDMRIGRLVMMMNDTDIDDGGYTGVMLEIGLNDMFIFETSFITPNRNAK